MEIIDQQPKEIKRLPKLYKKTSTGAIQEWEITVFDIEGVITLRTKYGQVGGKIQCSTEAVTSGKNIGRSNETTPLSQALFQADAEWTKQLKKGYVKTIEDAQNGAIDEIIEGGIAPMLAHKFSEQAHKIKYPALAQPKLDGHRCTSQYKNGEITLWSRTRKPITSVPHIVEAIKSCGLADPLDGELYNHEYHDKFEELSSVITSKKEIDEEQVLQYHVYDFPHPTWTNRERNALLQSLKPIFKGTPVHIVETIVVNDEQELMDAFNHFLAEGYEGCMVRNMDGKYVNKRSYDLQKIKEFDDREFEVIAVKIGTKGSMAGKAIFVCDVPELHGKCDDPTFDVVMKGTMEERQMYGDHPELAIGRQLTVKFQGYTKYGKPRFPVALRFRVDI